MLFDGFDQLSGAVEAGLGKLLAVERVLAKESISGNDLLRCEDLEALLLTFEQGAVTLRAIGADDTVVVSVGRPDEAAFPVRRKLSDELPWRHALGKVLWMVWSLTNHRGYPDAVQLEFIARGEGELRIQLEVAASRFRVYVVSQPGG